jgi:outer membrane autotransporter protein
VRVGLAGGVQGHAVAVGDRSSSADIETVHLAGYAATQHGPLGLRLGAAYAWHSIDTSRTIAFPGFSDITKAAYDGHTAQAFGELGYALAYGRLALEPYAGLAHVRMRSDSFGETGGAAALAGVAADFDTTFSTLGVRAALPFQTAAMQDVLLKGALGWRHAFNAATPLTQLAFSAGAPFTVAGVAIARDALVTEAGFDIAWSPNTTIGVTYAGQLAGSAADHGIKAQALRRF